MDAKILNRIFGALVTLAGTVILIENLSGFFYWLSDAGFAFAWEFLVIAGASLIIVAGGIVLVLTTLVRKPQFLSKFASRMQETILGRILMTIFGTDCFVMGTLILLLGLIGLYGPASGSESVSSVACNCCDRHGIGSRSGRSSHHGQGNNVQRSVHNYEDKVS